MKCAKCGKEIADNSNFCEYCGTKVVKNGNGNTIWIITIIVLVCVLALTGAGCYYQYGIIQQERAEDQKTIDDLKNQVSVLEQQLKEANHRVEETERRAKETAQSKKNEELRLIESERAALEKAKKDAERKKNDLSAQGWVDLCLPSGTLWKNKNEDGLYTYDQAMEKFKNNMPSSDQIVELRNSCKWERINGAVKVIGSNGKFIILPASGRRSADGYVNHVGSEGYYWSSMALSAETAYCLYIDLYNAYNNLSIYTNDKERNYALSVRLVR